MVPKHTTVNVWWTLTVVSYYLCPAKLDCTLGKN